MKLAIEMSQEALQDFVNISSGLFYPLCGFMNSKDYHSVVNNMTLGDESVWTIPITLDVNHETFVKAVDADRLYFIFNQQEVGYIDIEDCFRVNRSDTIKIFGTEDPNHPGVQRELEKSECRVGGKITLTDQSLLSRVIHPGKTREVFKKNGWKSIAGFQTRNPIHRAHEYIQRFCLELCDGIFINPVVGWKQPYDFSEEAIKVSYSVMLENHYPKNKVYFEFLKMPTRYAGPRDAIFHAMIRKNLGCTHFVIGRDHGGVGKFYSPYEAQDLAVSLRERFDLGIQLLLFKEPYYCNQCGFVVTERVCGCEEKYRVFISGTKIRETFQMNKKPDERFMRQDIAEAILALKQKMFV